MSLISVRENKILLHVYMLDTILSSQIFQHKIPVLVPHNFFQVTGETAGEGKVFLKYF